MDQSDAGSAGIFSRWTNQTQEALPPDLLDGAPRAPPLLAQQLDALVRALGVLAHHGLAVVPLEPLRVLARLRL
eukprot:5591159-Pyramimonas_sp.AAC.1